MFLDFLRACDKDWKRWDSRLGCSSPLALLSTGRVAFRKPVKGSELLLSFRAAWISLQGSRESGLCGGGAQGRKGAKAVVVRTWCDKWIQVLVAVCESSVDVSSPVQVRNVKNLAIS